jgi:hypothetical protein
MLRRATVLGLLGMLASSPAAADEPYERRGLRRAGIAIFTAGVASWPSSLALLLSTEGRLGPEAAGMLIAGQAMVAAGTPMWAAGDVGRATTPRDPTLMYAGMALAGIGLGSLPPTSALFAMSFDPEASAERVEQLRFAALGTAIVAHTLIAVGIPMWASGAAAPEDVLVAPTLGGMLLRARF